MAEYSSKDIFIDDYTNRIDKMTKVLAKSAYIVFSEFNQRTHFLLQRIYEENLLEDFAGDSRQNDLEKTIDIWIKDFIREIDSCISKNFRTFIRKIRKSLRYDDRLDQIIKEEETQRKERKADIKIIEIFSRFVKDENQEKFRNLVLNDAEDCGQGYKPQEINTDELDDVNSTDNEKLDAEGIQLAKFDNISNKLEDDILFSTLDNLTYCEEDSNQNYTKKDPKVAEKNIIKKNKGKFFLLKILYRKKF